MSKPLPALQKATQLKLFCSGHQDLVSLSATERRELLCAMAMLLCDVGLEDAASAENEEGDGQQNH